MRAFKSAAFIVLLPALAGLPAALADDSFYDVPVPGIRVDLGGYRLHLDCQGEGSPTVVLEAGLGDWSTHWTAVQNLLKSDTRVCSYDRAGYGWSDPGPRPRDSARIVSELHSLLELGGIKPPFLLVGHSFGGLNMRLYASTYVGEVAGLVLVDASHPDSLPYLRNEEGTAPATSFANQLMVMYPVDPEQTKFPLEAQAAIHDNLLRTKSMVTSRIEYRHLGASVKAVQKSPALGDVPLVVLSRGLRQWPAGKVGDEREQTWQAQQRELVNLSSMGSYRTAARSGHQIHLDQPEMVAEAVRELLAVERSRLMAVSMPP